METDKKPISRGPEKPIALKAHDTGSGIVIGACDAHLLGKKIREKGLVLELSKEFYFERHATADELSALVEECITANLVGEIAVGAYCKKNPGAKAAIRKVGGVSHLQVYQL